MGDILFENVILLVVPIMNIPDYDFLISGIIGVPEMCLMEEIQIKRDGSIVVPQHVKEETTLPNLFLSNLTGEYPYLCVTSGSDTLNMALDFGADASHLLPKYMTEHKEEIDQFGEPKEVSIYGTGGERFIKSYNLKEFSYNIGIKRGLLKSISIEKHGTDEDEYDGLIGQDMFLPFKQVNIDFKNMRLDVE